MPSVQLTGNVILEASTTTCHAEPPGTSSAVASVLYTRGGVGPQVTKSGSYIYHGEPANFHEWEFRTELRVKAAGTDPERYAEVMSRVVDGLRGEAFITAKDVGIDRLWQPGSVEGDDEDIIPGAKLLIDAIRRSVFPLTTHEAKVLFRQYCHPNGPLSRQKGESMQQYVSRRRRCWKLLTELDPQIFLSEGHRADMLLDLAGLEKQERTMIQASIGNARSFDKISDALIVQHPRIHTNEFKGRMVMKGDRISGKGAKGKNKGKSKGKGGISRPHRNPSGFAYHVTEEDFPSYACSYTAAEFDDSEP